MRAPITKVVKQVASSSNACSQYRCRSVRGAYSGIGRRYSTVEEAIGGVGSDMRLFGLVIPLRPFFRCYYEKQYPVPRTQYPEKTRRNGSWEEKLISDRRSDRSLRMCRRRLEGPSSVLGTDVNQSTAILFLA